MHLITKLGWRLGGSACVNLYKYERARELAPLLLFHRECAKTTTVSQISYGAKIRFVLHRGREILVIFASITEYTYDLFDHS